MRYEALCGKNKKRFTDAAACNNPAVQSEIQTATKSVPRSEIHTETKPV